MRRCTDKLMINNRSEPVCVNCLQNLYTRMYYPQRWKWLPVWNLVAFLFLPRFSLYPFPVLGPSLLIQLESLGSTRKRVWAERGRQTVSQVFLVENHGSCDSVIAEVFR